MDSAKRKALTPKLGLDNSVEVFHPYIRGCAEELAGSKKGRIASLIITGAKPEPVEQAQAHATLAAHEGKPVVAKITDASGNTMLRRVVFNHGVVDFAILTDPEDEQYTRYHFINTSSPQAKARFQELQTEYEQATAQAAAMLYSHMELSLKGVVQGKITGGQTFNALAVLDAIIEVVSLSTPMRRHELGLKLSQARQRESETLSDWSLRLRALVEVCALCAPGSRVGRDEVMKSHFRIGLLESYRNAGNFLLSRYRDMDTRGGDYSFSTLLEEFRRACEHLDHHSKKPLKPEPLVSSIQSSICAAAAVSSSSSYVPLLPSSAGRMPIAKAVGGHERVHVTDLDMDKINLDVLGPTVADAIRRGAKELAHFRRERQKRREQGSDSRHSDGNRNRNNRRRNNGRNRNNPSHNVESFTYGGGGNESASYASVARGVGGNSFMLAAPCSSFSEDGESPEDCKLSFPTLNHALPLSAPSSSNGTKVLASPRYPAHNVMHSVISSASDQEQGGEDEDIMENGSAYEQEREDRRFRLHRANVRAELFMMNGGNALRASQWDVDPKATELNAFFNDVAAGSSAPPAPVSETSDDTSNREHRPTTLQFVEMSQGPTPSEYGRDDSPYHGATYCSSSSSSAMPLRSPPVHAHGADENNGEKRRATDSPLSAEPPAKRVPSRVPSSSSSSSLIGSSRHRFSHAVNAHGSRVRADSRPAVTMKHVQTRLAEIQNALGLIVREVNALSRDVTAAVPSSSARCHNAAAFMASSQFTANDDTILVDSGASHLYCANLNLVPAGMIGKQLHGPMPLIVQAEGYSMPSARYLLSGSARSQIWVIDDLNCPVVIGNVPLRDITGYGVYLDVDTATAHFGARHENSVTLGASFANLTDTGVYTTTWERIVAALSPGPVAARPGAAFAATLRSQTARDTSRQLLHNILAHPGKQTLATTLRNSTGTIAGAARRGILGPCTTCAHRRANLLRSRPRYSRPQDRLMHMEPPTLLWAFSADTAGPFVPGILGDTYFTVFADLYRGATFYFAYPHAKRGDACDVFARFALDVCKLRELARHHRPSSPALPAAKDIVIIKHDQAGEFMSADMKNTFDSLNFISAPSVPHVSGTNGAAESAISVLKPRLRSLLRPPLLTDSGRVLSPQLWSLALGATVTISNSLHTPNNASGYACIKNAALSLDPFRFPFGTEVYYTAPGAVEKTSLVNTRARIGTYIGPEPLTGAWRVLTVNNDIVSAFHVEATGRGFTPTLCIPDPLLRLDSSPSSSATRSLPNGVRYRAVNTSQGQRFQCLDCHRTYARVGAALRNHRDKNLCHSSSPREGQGQQCPSSPREGQEQQQEQPQGEVNDGKEQVAAAVMVVLPGIAEETKDNQNVAGASAGPRSVRRARALIPSQIRRTQAIRERKEEMKGNPRFEDTVEYMALPQPHPGVCCSNNPWGEIIPGKTKVADIPEMRTMKQAKGLPHARYWAKAEHDEVNSLIANGTLVATQLPEGADMAPVAEDLKRKADADGVLVKLKVRKCERGDLARCTDYDPRKVFSPTASNAGFMVILILSCALEQPLYSKDGVTAFLQGPSGHLNEAYVRSPSSALLPHGCDGFAVVGNWYGFPTGASIWTYDVLKPALIHAADEVGASVVFADEDPMCVLIWREASTVKPLPAALLRASPEVQQMLAWLASVEYLMLGVHVDDNIYHSNSTPLRLQIEKKMEDVAQFTPAEQVDDYLKIKMQRALGCVLLSQPQQQRAAVASVGAEDANPHNTPADYGNQLRGIPEGRIYNSRDATYCAKALGTARYIADKTRPEICAGLLRVGRNQSNPGAPEKAALRRIAAYLKGEQHYRVVRPPPPCLSPATRETLERQNRIDFNDPLVVVVDASYNDDERGYSTVCAAVFLFGNLVQFTAKTLKNAKHSTGEAELCALRLGIREGIFIDNLLTSLHCRAPYLVVYTDSQVVVHSVNGQGINQRNKYYASMLRWVREQFEDERHLLRHVAGAHNVADIGTKPLPEPQFAYLRGTLLNEVPFTLEEPTLQQLLDCAS